MVNNTYDQYFYYVNSNSSAFFEFGTYDYPFKNFDQAAKELFNFMHNSST